MLELSNQSSWVAELYPDWDAKQQQQQLTAIFKISYQFDETGKLTLIEDAPPLIEADQHRGDALTSSLQAVSEIAPFKEGSEIYLYGTVRPDREGLVAMEVGGGNPGDDQDVFEANPTGFGYNSDQRNLFSEELPRVEMGPDFVNSPMQKPTPCIMIRSLTMKLKIFRQFAIRSLLMPTTK